MVSSEPLLLPVSLEGELSNSMKEMIGGCCVCSDERGWTENPLVYCDGHGCSVAVHQGEWVSARPPSGSSGGRQAEEGGLASFPSPRAGPLPPPPFKRATRHPFPLVPCWPLERLLFTSPLFCASALLQERVGLFPFPATHPCPSRMCGSSQPEQ